MTQTQEGREFFSADEARRVYEALGGVRIQMPPGTYAQRFLKWQMKASDASFADELRTLGFIDDNTFQLLKELAALRTRKRVRVTGHGFGWSETETVYEALLHVYELAATYDEAGAKMMFRGQRDSRWPILSTRQRSGTGLTREFSEAIRSCVRTKRRWSFDEQLEAAAQHYGFPTDMIDFSMDADVAAYFATLGGQSGVKGAIYLTDATTEGPDIALVFLPQIFWRIHQQAGIFFAAKSYSQADEVVRFEQSGKELEVYDYTGSPFAPLRDDGPIPRLADAIKKGGTASEYIFPAEHSGYVLTERFVQEVLCSWRDVGIVVNPELVSRIVESNLSWWTENIADFIDHCSSDPNALQRALMIREHVDLYAQARRCLD